MLSSKLTYILGLLAVNIGSQTKASDTLPYHLYNECDTCFNAGGRQCIHKDQWTLSTCCSPSAKTGSTYCHEGNKNVFCATDDQIETQEVKNFLCPSKRDANHCPVHQSDIEIWVDKKDQVFEREFNWSMLLPTKEAEEWYCKYRVLGNRHLVDSIQRDGFLIIDIIKEGFDNYVNIVPQRNEFYYQIHDGMTETKFFENFHAAQNGSRFILPADLDVFVLFAPESDADGSYKSHDGGKVKISAYITEKLTANDLNQHDLTFLNEYGDFENEVKKSEFTGGFVYTGKTVPEMKQYEFIVFLLFTFIFLVLLMFCYIFIGRQNSHLGHKLRGITMRLNNIKQITIKKRTNKLQMNDHKELNMVSFNDTNRDSTIDGIVSESDMDLSKRDDDKINDAETFAVGDLSNSPDKEHL